MSTTSQCSEAVSFHKFRVFARCEFTNCEDSQAMRILMLGLFSHHHVSFTGTKCSLPELSMICECPETLSDLRELRVFTRCECSDDTFVLHDNGLCIR